MFKGVGIPETLSEEDSTAYGRDAGVPSQMPKVELSGTCMASGMGPVARPMQPFDHVSTHVYPSLKQDTPEAPAYYYRCWVSVCPPSVFPICYMSPANYSGLSLPLQHHKCRKFFPMFGKREDQHLADQY